MTTLFDVDPAMLATSNSLSTCTVSADVVPNWPGADHRGLGDQQSALFGQAAFARVVKAPTDRAFILANVGENHPGVFDGLITTSRGLGEVAPDLRRRGIAFVAGAPCSGTTRWIHRRFVATRGPRTSVSDSAGAIHTGLHGTRFTVLARRRARIDHRPQSRRRRDRSRALVEALRIRCAR